MSSVSASFLVQLHCEHNSTNLVCVRVRVRVAVYSPPSRVFVPAFSRFSSRHAVQGAHWCTPYHLTHQ